MVTKKPMVKQYWLLLVIFLIALGLRVGFVLTLENKFYFPDSYQYDTVAQNIISGNGFMVSENLRAGRPPAYPLFLSISYLLFGKSLFVIRFIQALLSTLSCLVVYLIGKKVFDQRTGLIAAVITAIYPFFIFFSGLILTETIFILLLLVFIYLLINLEQRGNIWLAVLAGVINGVAILTRAS
ncbi:ArnT family glycosyltransferase, partial [Planctomycetota bacterium]